jgi:hypothetical protein
LGVVAPVARALLKGTRRPFPFLESAMSAENALKLIKDNEVEFVDLRFADLLG